MAGTGSAMVKDWFRLPGPATGCTTQVGIVESSNVTCDEDGWLIAKSPFGVGSSVNVRWPVSTNCVATCNPLPTKTSEVGVKLEPAIVIVCAAPSAVTMLGVTLPITGAA